jgi:peroxiredoxin
LGDTVSNFSLVGCDNTTLSVHELCENKAVYFFTYTGWCPNCQGHAKTASAVYAELSSLGEDFEMFVVVTEDAAGKAPTKAYCESIEAKFGLTMPVVYDPTGAVQAGLGLNSPNDWHVVLAPGGKLSVKSKYSQDPAVKAVETLLGE